MHTSAREHQGLPRLRFEGTHHPLHNASFGGQYVTQHQRSISHSFLKPNLLQGCCEDISEEERNIVMSKLILLSISIK